MKCDAHQKGEDKISLGNNLLDQTAKAALKRETEPGKGMLVLTRAQIAKKNPNAYKYKDKKRQSKNNRYRLESKRN